MSFKLLWSRLLSIRRSDELTGTALILWSHVNAPTWVLDITFGIRELRIAVGGQLAGWGEIYL
jgi:hypothetical protein